MKEDPVSPPLGVAAAQKIEDRELGQTVLRARLDVSRLNPGHYLLGIRPPGVEWSYYPLIVR